MRILTLANQSRQRSTREGTCDRQFKKKVALCQSLSHHIATLTSLIHPHDTRRTPGSILDPVLIILTIAGGMPTLRAAEGVPIVTGIPVNASRRVNDYDDYEEDISTDQMQTATSGRPPIVRGHRISELRQQASHSPTSQRMMACLNIVSGIILP